MRNFFLNIFFGLSTSKTQSLTLTFCKSVPINSVLKLFLNFLPSITSCLQDFSQFLTDSILSCLFMLENLLCPIDIHYPHKEYNAHNDHLYKHKEKLGLLHHSKKIGLLTIFHLYHL